MCAAADAGVGARTADGATLSLPHRSQLVKLAATQGNRISDNLQLICHSEDAKRPKNLCLWRVVN
jgi:hypothetical protein